MTSRLSRFLHLERPRGERPTVDASARLQNGSRFESVVGPGEAPGAVAVPEAHLERFKRHGEVPLALEQEAADARSFQRCMRCEGENGRFAVTCGVCGADLGSPEQRAYSEQRWQAQEQAEAGRREALRAEEQRREEARRREAASQFEQLVERLRKEERGHSWLVSVLSEQGSVGLVLLRRMGDRRVRQAVAVGCVLVPLLLVRFGEGWIRLAGLGLGALLGVLFVPSWLWRVRR